MPKYKFNIDHPILPEQQIDKHKDFKKLIHSYQNATKPLYKTPLYKNKMVFLIILLILLITFLISEYVTPEKVKEEHKTDQQP